MFYVTPRVVAMGFPFPHRIESMSSRLLERHGQHCMVWNLSEKRYDYSAFDNQVIEICFPGYPAPPLGLLFKICASMESWLRADPQNVVVVHCATGRGSQ